MEKKTAHKTPLPLTVEQERFFTENINLVYSVMHRHFPKYVYASEGEDYFQEGAIGLLHAVRHFDPSSGVKFSSYACLCISGYIHKYRQNFINNVGGVRWSDNQKKRYFEYRKLQHLFSEEEIVKKMGLSSISEIRFPEVDYVDGIKINENEGDEGLTPAFEKQPSAEDEAMDSVTENEVLRVARKHLSRREYDVFALCVDANCSQSEVARHMGVSRAYVGQVIRKFRNVAAAIREELVNLGRSA